MTDEEIEHVVQDSEFNDTPYVVTKRGELCDFWNQYKTHRSKDRRAAARERAEGLARVIRPSLKQAREEAETETPPNSRGATS